MMVGGSRGMTSKLIGRKWVKSTISFFCYINNRNLKGSIIRNLIPHEVDACSLCAACKGFERFTNSIA